jgi:hypothetical protein
MSLAINNPQGAPRKIIDIKKILIMEFHRPKSEDQFMNEVIEVRKKP